MTHFGNKKDAEGWFKFRNKDEADSLGKKLNEENRKRKAAEKEVTRLKKEVAHLEEVIKTFTGMGDD